jgi:hypothetical protein
MPGSPTPPPALPSQISFGWSPIQFPGSGLGISGNMQVDLFQNGGFSFTGTFYDPDMLDYDDSLAIVVAASNGEAFSLTHTGSMHGWGDRWYEGGSASDTWSNTGTNPVIAANWSQLCAGWSWQAQAGINLDVGDLLNEVEGLIKVVTTVIQIVELVAAA